MPTDPRLRPNPPPAPDDFQLEYGEFAAETFPSATPTSIVTHLHREVVELFLAARDCQRVGFALRGFDAPDPDPSAGPGAAARVRAAAEAALADIPLGQEARRLRELRDRVAEEAADCYALLIHLAYLLDFSFYGEGLKKCERNYDREWAAPDEQGVVEHKRDPAERARKERELTEGLTGLLPGHAVFTDFETDVVADLIRDYDIDPEHLASLFDYDAGGYLAFVTKISLGRRYTSYFVDPHDDEDDDEAEAAKE